MQDALTEEAKNKGKYEHGIVTLQAQSIATISRELLHVDTCSGERFAQYKCGSMLQARCKEWLVALYHGLTYLYGKYDVLSA